MVLVIKRFKTTLKGCKDYPNKNKSRGKRSCFKCGKSGHFIAQCLDNENDQDRDKKEKKDKNKFYRIRRARGTSARNETRSGLHQTRTTKDLPPPPSTNHPSSPMSIRLA
jgi:hypothetical protein